VETVLAVSVRALHLLWIAWILLGWVFTRGRPILAGLHVASLFWGIAVELGPWECPLTQAELWLERRAHTAPYHHGFIVHYLDRLLYPDLPETLVGWAGAAVCCAILAEYARRLVQRRM
jgi:hypothetical protein